MTRAFQIHSAGYRRENTTRAYGSVRHDSAAIIVSIVSLDLKSQPVHSVEVSESDALKIAAQLLEAVRTARDEQNQ